jgi:hypothetical protein
LAFPFRILALLSGTDFKFVRAGRKRSHECVIAILKDELATVFAGASSVSDHTAAPGAVAGLPIEAAEQGMGNERETKRKVTSEDDHDQG